MTDEELCRTTKADGEECDYPAKHDDGKCGIHTEETDDADPGGRPSKFTDEKSEACIKAAKEGKSQAGCARAAGVDKATLSRWLDANEEFRNAFRRARARGESMLIDGGLRDEDVDSSMAKFLLASSFEYKKSEKQEVEHSGEIDGTREHTVDLDSETAAAIREATLSDDE